MSGFKVNCKSCNTTVTCPLPIKDDVIVCKCGNKVIESKNCKKCNKKFYKTGSKTCCFKCKTSTFETNYKIEKVDDKKKEDDDKKKEEKYIYMVNSYIYNKNKFDFTAPESFYNKCKLKIKFTTSDDTSETYILPMIKKFDDDDINDDNTIDINNSIIVKYYTKTPTVKYYDNKPYTTYYDIEEIEVIKKIDLE